MIKFIIVGSNDIHISNYKYLIAKSLMRKECCYKYHKFNNDDKNLEKYIEANHQNNIFIIENKNEKETVGIIDTIRNRYNDIESFIIIINFSDKNCLKSIESQFLYNTIILNSNENYNDKLIKTIDQITNCYENKKNCITFLSKGIVHQIPFLDILYIEKKPNTKLSIIHCKDEQINVNKTLTELSSGLDDNFIFTHRSALINKLNVKTIDFNENKIVFNNGEECYLLSRNYKKETKNHFTKQE